jgi:hypothetical protein
LLERRSLSSKRRPADKKLVAGDLRPSVPAKILFFFDATG